jgi:hypothetical protein
MHSGTVKSSATTCRSVARRPDTLPPQSCRGLAPGHAAIVKLIRQDTAKRPMPLTIFAGVTAAMLLLYVTGVPIK